MNKRIASLLIATLLLSSCSMLPSWLGGTKEQKPKLPGERYAALPATAELAVDADANDGPISLPQAIANSEWPQAGVFTADTGHLAGGNFDQQNSARAGEGEEFTHTLIPRPVVGGGLVFALDALGHISAHEAGNISNVRWTSAGVAVDDDEQFIGGGLAYEGGILYVSSGRGIVAAFDATTGNEKWRKDLHIPLRSVPHVSKGQLLVVTMENQTFALSAKDGSLLWDHRGINEVAGLMNTVSPLEYRGVALVPYSSGELFALMAADGKEIWGDVLSADKRTQGMGVFNGVGGDPVVDGDAVFASGSNGVTAAIHIPRGARVWERQAASVNTPWVAGNELYVLTTDNVLVNFVKYNGHVRWATQLPSYLDPELRLKPISWRGPVLVNGRLLLTGSHGELVLISAANGKIVATQEIPEGIYSAPTVTNGRLYLVGKDATLYVVW